MPDYNKDIYINDYNVQGHTIHARVNKECLKQIMDNKNDLNIILTPDWRDMDLLNPAWRKGCDLSEPANHADLWCFNHIRDFVINGKYLLTVDQYKVKEEYIDEYDRRENPWKEVLYMRDFYRGYIELVYYSHLA